jgi:hypothetical protein
MAHPLLLISSLTMTIPHFLAVYWFSCPYILQLSYLSGLSTSVWNHGTTNIVALWSDRLMMMIGFGIDFYFMYMLSWNEGTVVFVLTIASVSCYFCAKFMSGFEIPKSKKDKPLTMKEIELMPSLFHVLAHLFVSMSHVFMLYFCAHGSNGSIVGAGGTENVFNYQLSRVAGIASLASYFLCDISKVEGEKKSDFPDHFNSSRIRN